jgi:O-antigen/teichoic acid export membrane protein
LTVPIVLVLTPYIIKHVGKQEFGIWALVGVISSYAQLSDFGITESLVKFMAEYQARNDAERINKLINTAFTIYILLSVTCCLLFLLVLPYVVETILNIPQSLQDKAMRVFTIAIVLFSINMIMGVFGSLIIGFQRMGYSNLISLLSTVLTAAGTVFFLYNGYGLDGLIYNNCLVTLFVVLANILAARHLFPQLRINPFVWFSREILASIFGFSWKIQITNVTQLMIFQVDRVLLSHYLGLEAVSYYEVANRIATQARGFVASIFSPMVPAASALHANEENDKVTGLYRRSFKYMTIAAVPLSLLVIALAHPFVRTWMGPNYETSAITLQLLMFAYMLNLLTGPGSFILSGINKPHIGMRSSVLAGITNLILCLLFVRWIGYYGIILGILISIVTSGGYFVWMVHKNIQGLSWRIYLNSLVKPVLVSICACVPLVVIDRLYPIGSYSILVLLGIVYAFVVGYALFQGRYLDEFDRATIGKLNPLRSFK